MMLEFSLNVYRRSKRSLGGNLRGDVPLALARVGILPTKSHRKYEDPQQDGRTRNKRGICENTARHVISEGDGAYYTDEDFLSRLGLQEEIKSPSPEQKTKVVLEIRGKETNDQLRAPDVKG